MGYHNKQMKYSRLDMVGRIKRQNKSLHKRTEAYEHFTSDDRAMIRVIEQEAKKQKLGQKKQKRNYLMRLYFIIKTFILND